ncbi:hypothetical protein ABPG72_004388 [Tetrahymena utriculariae]
MNSLIPQVEFQEGEEIKYKADQIPLKITSNMTENFVIFNDGMLCITNQRVVFANIDQKIFQLEYKNVVSHGIQDTNLVCYLNGGESQENNDEEEDGDYQDEEEKQYFAFLANSKNELINLQGDYEVRFSFEKNLNADISSAFSIFSECSALNPDADEDESHVANLMGGMMDFDFDSMVTAKDIDENGNLISNKQDLGENDEEEDEEEEEEYTDDEDGEEQEEVQGQDQNKSNEKQNNGENMELE